MGLPFQGEERGGLDPIADHQRAKVPRGGSLQPQREQRNLEGLRSQSTSSPRRDLCGSRITKIEPELIGICWCLSGGLLR